MLGFLNKLFDSNEKQLDSARKVVDRINELSPQVEQMSYTDMRTRLDEMRADLKLLVDQLPAEQRNSLKRIDREKGLPESEKQIQEKLQQFLPEVYAFIRDTYRREFGIKHYDVQLLAGVMLARGQTLTELKTGEGKTMVFNLPLFLYSLVGRGAHLVTVNEYLVKRDAEYAGHIADKLGISVGIVAPGGASFKFINDEEVIVRKGEEFKSQIEERGVPRLANMAGLNLIETSKKEAYNCDITVSVNNELGFDYLRDNMAWQFDQLVQRELYFCIIDEADSILIDEARTPLIISATPSDSDVDKYTRFARAVSGLEEDKDYTVDHKTRSVVMTDDGIEAAQKALGVENIWSDYSMAHHIENALKAKALFLKDDQYMVKDGEILIVDQFTGRVLPGRRYSEGLHQAIEAKENVEVKQESQTFATITFQNFFRLYKILAGGSGTIMTEAEEFYKIYNVESIEIPTNTPVIREDMNDLIYRDQAAKHKALTAKVKELYDKQQPVLIGTTSIEKSEEISKSLDEAGIPHSVLNAKYHEREAQIVKKAGQKGAITVATNMAGRGTDIPLGEGVKELGGLAVIGTERHESRRIDNQLRGRSGRQGDPGFSRFYVALDDTIMRVMAGDMLQNSVGRLMVDDAPIEMGMISKQIETAQKRVESMNFDERKRLVDYDDVMNQQREVFYSRRRRLMEVTENALGKFRLDLQELQVTEKTAEAKERLADMMRDVVHTELEYIVESHMNGSRELSDSSVETVVAHLLDMAPDVFIASGFDQKPNEISNHLKQELQGKETEEALTFLFSGFDRMLTAKVNEFGDELPTAFKMLMLDSMDKQWVDHLETMADIRSGIGLQGYAQRDPLVEYKNIGFQTFQGFISRIDGAFARRIFKIAKVNQPVQQRQQNLETNSDEITDIVTGDREMKAGSVDLNKVLDRIEQDASRVSRQVQNAGGVTQAATNTDKQVGRNDPCFCGSGLKYKKCGLINSEVHKQHLK